MTGAGEFREHGKGTFVYTLDDALAGSVCEEMIQRFEASPTQQYSGRIGPQGIENPEIKRSTDLRISGREDWRDIDQALQQSLQTALGLLAGLHPFFSANPVHDIGYNLQRTRQSEYYHWHTDSGPGDFARRQLVAIWYLNDLAIGGETEFHFQDVSITPQQGRLLLFPPFWTHIHRGAEVTDKVKYIATTWICV